MVLFLIQAFIISLTGVMAPGPVTAVTVGAGTRSPHAGALVAIGHGIIEFPLMVLIYFGLGHVLSIGYVKATIFTLGGMFLLFMGIDMLRSISISSKINSAKAKQPLFSGFLLSLGNVYFLIWWVTVGASLITKAVTFGLIGILSFAVVHWLCDFMWLYFLSAVSFKSGHFFGIRFQKFVYAVCGIFLLFFSYKNNWRVPRNRLQNFPDRAPPSV